MPEIDKAIITNRAAVVAKYGVAGAASVRQTIERLIAADAARGLTSVVFEIDDAAQMAAVNGNAVINASDERGAKQAVDAIYVRETPDYILLLDGPDVVPHITLNPVAGITDADQSIASDLPFACAAAFGKKAQAYLGVTRVVGRLPAALGETDPQRLIELIDHSIRHTGRPGADYSRYFSISTEVWQQSTQLSLSSLFGDHTSLFLAPAHGHPAIDPSLAHLVHFINCHGATANSRFYGEGAGPLPTAMESQLLQAQGVTAGTVVAAECCYGAQLYDYRMVGDHQPICMTYLGKGAAAFMGSTNISYGPPKSNAQADLMTQYFLEEILAGASTGRAMLQARQRFVQTQTMASPVNLKTLAQFVLYGDPSLHPVLDAEPARKSVSGLVAAAPAELAVDAASQRKFRRIALATEGKTIASSASMPGKKIDPKEGLEVLDRFRDIAAGKGYNDPPDVLSVTGGAQFRSTGKTMENERRVVIATKEKDGPKAVSGEQFPSYEIIVGHILGSGIIAVEECESR
ncbi:hypothetical protein JQ597_19095 [Bradyrhizobium sp. AUGA SZCCT0177]|uniref:C25 family cysteine peptidase n=1 Tax=Bradyrhizobium sp. AUGA SZCCT0177 TaxID=2807665 RepID=UPI001BA77AE1|nr:C25 family cysteine peptidase [Bradyrhizobium sp. AUGA SZCCT0177]MBR1284159.1 hypothetical protein [Bradyrhizobium sp. AUGA SZCCT0177]